MKVFTFWDKGETKLPELNRRNIEIWKRFGLDVTVVSLETLGEFIDKTKLPENFDKLGPEHQSDCVRMLLLLEYAPCVWMDSSIVITQNIDWWTTDVVEANPDVTYTGFYLGEKSYVENWAMFSVVKNNPLLIEWRDLFFKLLGAKGMADSPILQAYNDKVHGVSEYLRMHCAVMHLITTNPDFKEKWERETRLFDAAKEAFAAQVLSWGKCGQKNIASITRVDDPRLKDVKLQKYIGCASPLALSDVKADRGPTAVLYSLAEGRPVTATDGPEITGPIVAFSLLLFLLSVFLWYRAGINFSGRGFISTFSGIFFR